MEINEKVSEYNAMFCVQKIEKSINFLHRYTENLWKGSDNYYSFPVLSTMILLKDSLFSQGSEYDWSLSKSK